MKVAEGVYLPNGLRASNACLLVSEGRVTLVDTRTAHGEEKPYLRRKKSPTSGSIVGRVKGWYGDRMSGGAAPRFFRTDPRAAENSARRQSPLKVKVLCSGHGRSTAP